MEKGTTRPWILRILSLGIHVGFLLPFATLVYTMKDCGTMSSPAVLNSDPIGQPATRVPLPKKEIRTETHTGYALLARPGGAWLLLPTGIAALFLFLSLGTQAWRRMGPGWRLALRTMATVGTGAAGAVLALWVPPAPTHFDVEVVPQAGYWLSASSLALLTLLLVSWVVQEYNRLWKSEVPSRLGRGLMIAGVILAELVLIVPLVWLTVEVNFSLDANLVGLYGVGLLHGVVFLLLPVALLVSAPLGLVGGAVLRRAHRRIFGSRPPAF